MNSTLNLTTASEDPMPDTIPGEVGQQQLKPHEMSDTSNEWTGRLYMNWNGTYAPARALASDAIGDPYTNTFL